MLNRNVFCVLVGEQITGEFLPLTVLHLLSAALTPQRSNHTAIRAAFDLTKESYYPFIIGNASQGGGVTS